MKPETYYQRIASVMRDNQFDRTTSGHRSGKIGKKLYKVSMNTDRVFDRVEERKNKHYNVVLSIDESGSMHRQDYETNATRIEIVAHSASLMAKAMNHSGINLAVVGFNQYIRIHKSFREHFTNKQYNSLEKDIIEASHYGSCCNHDYVAALQVEQLIHGMDPAHTFVMLFLDGRPACECPSSAADPGRVGLLAKTTKRIASKSMFITFGVGVGSASIESFYPNVVHIKNANEFMNRSLYAIQATIRRG